MANYCFVSIQHPAHCDLGGHGFVRTAQMLQERGHRVTWVFSYNPYPSSADRALEIVRSHGIRVEKIDNLDLLPLYFNMFKMAPSAQRLKAYFDANDYHAIVIDRSCPTATFAAHQAHIPWAVVGSDGRDWVRTEQMEEPKYRQPESGMDRRIRDTFSWLANNDYPRPSVGSCFGTSPFLNLSFFPKDFYRTPGADIPAQSHFLGDDREAERSDTRERLLVTFGNTMPGPLQQELIKVMVPLLKVMPIPTLFLTGNQELTSILRNLYPDQPHVEVRDWLPYDEAFADARAVIGHGGSAHVWHGIREGAPLLALPWLADQWFGAKQIERLGIGHAVEPRSATGQALGRSPEGARINGLEMVDKLEELFTQPEALANTRHISDAMCRGGGVPAAASLLERLAVDKAAITDCASPVCCC